MLGAGHHDTLTSRENLAAAYLAADRAGEAIALLEANLTEAQRAFGSHHELTARARDFLADAIAERDAVN